MASADFTRGAQMALQAFGIADRMQQQDLMNQLHKAQLAKAERDVQSERAVAAAGQEFMGNLIPPYEVPGGNVGMLQPTEQNWNNLAAKLAGIPGQLPQAVNIMKSLNADTPQDRLMRAMLAMQGKQAPELTGTARNLEVLLGRKPTIQELKEYGQDEAKPYYTPVPSSEGFMIFNNRTGRMEPMTGGAGKPVLPVTADPALAGAKKGAEETAELQAKKRASFPKVRDAFQSLNRQWDIVDKSVDKALSQVSNFTAGIGAWTSIIPATPAKNLAETIKMIQANVGFDKLQDMRANSPTGGALGQVSDLENRLLQAVQGSLDIRQSPSQLKENLTTIKATLQQMRAQKDFAFKYDFKDMIGSMNTSNKIGRFTVEVEE